MNTQNDAPLLIECPACKSQVSSRAPSCPKCGQPIAINSFHPPSFQQSSSQSAESFQQQVSPPRRRGCGGNLGLGCLGLIGLLFLVSLIGTLLRSSGDRDAQKSSPQQSATASPIATPLQSTANLKNSNQTSSENSLPDSGLVYITMQRYLRDHLNDPASLDDLEILGVSPMKKSGSYRVVVSYRAKNGFGALVMQQQRFILTRAPVGTGDTLFFNVRPG